MTTDYAEVERQFLASLKATTGRDLADWMAAIESQSLPHRNDVIDWLRQQGFPFARASWLQRIHENGGKPLYPASPGAKTSAPAGRVRPPAKARPPAPAPGASATVIVLAERARAAPAPPPQPRTEATTPSSSPMAPANWAAAPALDGLLAKAKAYRPLAQFLLREIEKAVPGSRATPHPTHVSLGAPGEFAILTVSPKELRLGLDLGPAPHTGPLQKTKFGAGLPVARNITHMILLTDARQVNADLMAQIRAAAARANARPLSGH